MTRRKALKLLYENVKNQNLIKHCLAVEASMRALYRRLNDGKLSEKKEESWGIAGLVHDADYEITKDRNPRKNHTKYVLKWLRKLGAEKEIYDAVSSHAWGYVEGATIPKTKMQWALYCCDELTGLIVAVVLVMPDKKLASVTVDSIMRKWNSPSFARGVNRKQIEKCENRLGIPLREFIQITLNAMQGISNDLGL